jgi:hypothetical protein
MGIKIGMLQLPEHLGFFELLDLATLLLHLNHTSTDNFKFIFFPHTVVLWNALPPDIVSSSSLDQFKSQIQTHYI